MKKFLIFLVATIVTVCIGIIFYQFAKNDEIIKVEAQTVYINYGDKLSLDDIGFSRIDASKDTKINFNAGGDEVTSIIKYDEVTKCYIPTSKGGTTTIKISTTNRKYKSFNIDVVVGIGTEECPFYISTETQLADIGYKYDLSACYELVNDITLTNVHTPIGLVDGNYKEFDGEFNGNYHSINGLKVETCTFGGLFSIIGSNGLVYNININNPIIEGSYLNVGAVSGICYGTINKVVVSNPTISNDSSIGITGAVVGTLMTDTFTNNTASILRTSAYTDQNTIIKANSTLGGLAGMVDSAAIQACYTNLLLQNTSNNSTGGLVGNFLVNTNSYIRESYSISVLGTSGTVGNIAGKIDLASNVTLNNINTKLVLVGLYFDNTLNNFDGVGVDKYNFSSATTFAVNGKSTAEMKTKSNYIYYVNSANELIPWDKVWYRVDGEYPTLTFVNQFDEIILEDNTQHPTTPDNPNETPDDSDGPDITNPDNPNTDTIIISNKQDLIDSFQTGNLVTGNYILSANIDLEGITWTPVSFTGTFKSNNGNNYTISNFKINSSKLYSGFFYVLSSANISNINFYNVQVVNTGANETAGIVVGYIAGNTVIDNVCINTATISSASKYAGSIVGYVGTNVVEIRNCQVTNLNISEALNVGGIAGYVASNTYINSCKLINSNNISGVDRVGGIASVNYGKINDCYYDGNISSYEIASAAGYFGGLCGVNYGAITNSTTYAEINVVNNATSSSSIYYFVGGLCGYNLGSIYNCSAYANSYNCSKSTNAVYFGGLTAYNRGNLSYCLADVDSIGSVRANVSTAGLSVYNYGGTIFGSFAFANLNGYHVAGLVRLNSNKGIIDSCIAGLDLNSRATFKGVEVVSFAHEIPSGTISNCLVNANLTCTSNSGWIAGFAGFMSCNNDIYGTISYSIANVSFTGIGSKYLDIAQEGLMKKDRTTGTITNCVISEDAKVEDIIISKYSKFLWFTRNPGSDSNYIVANANEMKDIETYLDIDTCDFDIESGITDSKWMYINNTYIPIPRAIAVLFSYDFI